MFNDFSNILASEKSDANGKVSKVFTFIYKCPSCATIINVGVPLVGNKLHPDFGVTCSNCKNQSRISNNMSFVKKIFRIINLDSIDDTTSEELLIDSIAACSALIIAADGLIKREEVKEFKDFCSHIVKSENSMDIARSRLNFYLENQEKTYSSIRKLANLDSVFKRAIFELLFCIAYADGDFDPREESKINHLAQIIEISKPDFEKVKEQYVCASQNNFEVLGIPPTSNFKIIKEAYRKKCLEFHPDRHQNLPESLKNFAEQQFKIVQNAYDTLRKQYENV